MAEFKQSAEELLARPEVRAILIVVVSLIVAVIVERIVSGVLKRLAQRSKTPIDDRLIATLHRPIFVTVLLVGLRIATRVLDMGDPFEGICLGVLNTLIVFVWTIALLRVISVAVDGLNSVAPGVSWIDGRMLPLIDNTSKVVVIAGAIYAFLVIWSLDLKPWLGTAGIVGIALGFAAKDSLANLFGGMSIIVDAPYKIGDYINLDGGERGMVTKIGLRSTRILTRDDIEITLPNSMIANAKIINESSGRWTKSRITVKVGVAYGSDVELVRTVLVESAASVDLVLSDPAPRVRFTEFGDSALIFRLLCWIDEPADRGLMLDAVNTAVYKNFNAHGIKIPFPQRELSFDPSVKELIGSRGDA
jgi:small-conductance mechanosensitive channel